MLRLPGMTELTFQNSRTHDPSSVPDLDAVHQSQLIEALMMYCGTRWDSVAEALAGFEKEQGYPLEIELWDIVDSATGTARFEYWVQGAGDGMVFDYGTDVSPECIGSTQHRFQSHAGDDAETLALVDALQKAAKKAGL